MSTVLDTLITDRTSADLVADLDKVYADYICLNRVEQACALLAQRFGVDIKIKEWKMEDFRTDTEMLNVNKFFSLPIQDQPHEPILIIDQIKAVFTVP